MNAIVYPPTVIDGADTTAKLFWKRVKQYDQKVALREKDLGIWRSITWEEYGAKAQAIGLGLVSMGLQRGETVSILSDNNKEWLFFDMGILAVGGVSNGVYTTDSSKQVEYLCKDSDTRYFVAENEEQLDKLLEVRDQLPDLRKIIVLDMEGLRDFDDDMVISIDELYKLGEAYHQENPSFWEEAIGFDSQAHAARLIREKGVQGMIEYWNHSLTMEEAGYALSATDDAFRIDMHECPSKGYLIDFADVKRATAPIEEALDHRVLNEIEGLENPTAELLCKWVWDKLKPTLPLLSCIRVHETCTSSAEYRGD